MGVRQMDPRLMQAAVHQQPANVVGAPPAFNGSNSRRAVPAVRVPTAGDFIQLLYAAADAFRLPATSLWTFFHALMPPQPPLTPPDPLATKEKETLSPSLSAIRARVAYNGKKKAALLELQPMHENYQENLALICKPDACRKTTIAVRPECSALICLE
eukprot:6179673-Pleurochrysis_carterae.AAC.1